MNSLQIYNLTKEEDLPYITVILENLNEIIRTNVLANKMNFHYDFLDIVHELSAEQINRINDEIIKYCRANGLRVTMTGEYLYKELIDKHEDLDLEHFISEYDLYFANINSDNPLFYYRNYNYVNRPNHIINIKLNTRLNREYMKSYV